MIARREVGNGDRRDAVIDTVDQHLRAGGLRLHAQLTGHRRVGELEVLRNLARRR